ncbi:MULTISPECIES: DUF3077 domain-containing protein [unclassified Pseudomonas]|uniref:DUF3077 domain-containing protein n=1 Tax=unclassified Pseudomonas TaxID=196821 RepID=UPI0035BF05F8
MNKIVPDPPYPLQSSTAGVTTYLELYRIQPGIPFAHAFGELSVLLGCIRHLTCEAELESDRIASSAARLLSAMAKALIDDMEVGMNRTLRSSMEP